MTEACYVRGETEKLFEGDDDDRQRGSRSADAVSCDWVHFRYRYYIHLNYRDLIMGACSFWDLCSLF